MRKKLPHRPGPWAPYDPREGFVRKPTLHEPVPAPDVRETSWDTWDQVTGQLDQPDFPDTILEDRI